MSSKNDAMMQYLLDCPTIQANPLFFNFCDEKDNYNQVVVDGNDTALSKPYIDGSILKRYTFTIVSYKSVSYNAVIKMSGYEDENMADIAELQEMLDWLKEQADANVFPDFGTSCQIDSMEVTTDNPNLIGINVETKPPLAKYTIEVVITYLDTTKMIFN